MRTVQLVRLNLELMEAWTWRESSGRHARSFRKRPMSAVRAERSVIQIRRRISVGLGPFPRTGGALRALPAVSSRLAQFVNRSILALAIRRQDRVKSAGHLSIGPYAETSSPSAKCSIKMLRTPKGEAGFYEFDQFERLVEVSARESQAELVVLLGGEAGLRCGEMIGLEWSRGHPAVGRAGGNSWRNRGGVGNEGLSPPFLFEEIGGGAGSCTRVRKYIPAGIYDAYPPLICRPRREEAARTAGGQPRNISLPPSRTTGVSQPAELTSVPHPQADEDGRSQGFRLRV